LLNFAGEMEALFQEKEIEHEFYTDLKNVESGGNSVFKLLEA
jgi:hypothetical protein